MRVLKQDLVSQKKSKIVVRRSALRGNRGVLRFGKLSFPCALGKTGMTIFKREGDGATPIGRFALLHGFYRHDRGVKKRGNLPMRAVKKSDGWCDASSHSCYNRSVQLPFNASHEEMTRKDCLYDVCIVLDYNITSRQRGKGSAIFFHMAKPDFKPTLGCIALAPTDMIRLLPFLRQGMVMVVQ